MFRCLTNEQEFIRRCKTDDPWLFRATRFGLMVRTTTDFGFGSDWTSSHIGKYVQVMAELGVAESQLIATREAPQSGSSYSLSDVIFDDVRRVHLDCELEFTAVGLARYLHTARWENRYRQWIGFDDIAERIARQPLGQGVCFGCHAPFALATMSAVQRNWKLLSPAVAALCERRLRECVDFLVRSQQPDGSWTPDWAREATPRTFTWGSREIDNLAVTGHIVEWLAIRPVAFRPPSHVLGRACEFISRTIASIGDFLAADWHVFLPASHAAKGVLELCDPECSVVAAQGIVP